MKKKLLFWFKCLIEAAILLTAVSMTIGISHMYNKRVENDVFLHARMLAVSHVFQDAYEESGGDVQQLDLDDIVEMIGEDVQVTWLKTDGTILFDNDPYEGESEDDLERPEIRSALENGSGEQIRRNGVLKQRRFFYALKLDDGTILRTSQIEYTTLGIMKASLPYLFVICAGCFFVIILIGRGVLDRVMNSLDEMIRHIDDSSYEPKYPELKPFVEAIKVSRADLTKSIAARQDFTANVTHELKTPLTAIVGYAELIENRIVTTEMDSELAWKIRKSAEHMVSMIDDTIKLSELDHTERPLRFVQVDLYDLAKKCCEEMQINAEMRNVTLNCTGRLTVVNGDPSYLKEMLENLIQNAIRYNVENGNVTVTVSNTRQGKVLSVQDTGIGIPEDQLDRVFERFYRVDRSHSSATGGTGLGLAIVKNIVKIHNAKIEISSKLNEGTTISIHF